MSIADVQVKEDGCGCGDGEQVDLNDVQWVNLMKLDDRLNMG